MNMRKMREDSGMLRLRYAVQLTKYIKGFGVYLFFAIVSNLIFKILPLITSVVTSYLVSSVLLGDATQVVKLMTGVGILVLLMSLFSYLDVQVSHDMAYRILTQLRDKCYDKLDELAPAALMGKRSGDMINIVLGDVETLEWFYAHTIGQIIVAVIIPVTTLFFMGHFSWILPLVILPFIIALIMVPKRSAKQSDVQGMEVKETTGKLCAMIVDGVQGMKDIISFRWQREYFERFFDANEEYAKASLQYAKRRSNESRQITLLMEIATLVSDIVATVLVVQGMIPTLWLMPLFVMSSAIFAPILDALTMSTNYGLIFGAAKRVLGLFEMEPMVCDEGTMILACEGKETQVSFEQVSFAYPSATKEEKTEILGKINFSFHTGETVALVGASGSGKTTIARLLQRFWDVDSGRICINGTDIRNILLENLRELVTVVPQEVYLFNLSVKENLRLSKADATDEEIREAIRNARADTFVDKLPQRYDTLIGERGLRLSGGEKQRLSIAQAFLKNSPVLVLDEASANLDAENERFINEAVKHLKKGRATLVIAHRISTIRSADRIVVIKDGNVVDTGTYQELIERCSYFSKLIGEEYEKE